MGDDVLLGPWFRAGAAGGDPRPVSEFDVGGDLEWVHLSTVLFCVYDSDISDEDDDALNTTVPFQVAYAVSIHTAQGLEYDSVKLVITDANEDDIAHSIFHTGRHPDT